MTKKATTTAQDNTPKTFETIKDEVKALVDDMAGRVPYTTRVGVFGVGEVRIVVEVTDPELGRSVTVNSSISEEYSRDRAVYEAGGVWFVSHDINWSSYSGTNTLQISRAYLTLLGNAITFAEHLNENLQPFCQDLVAVSADEREAERLEAETRRAATAASEAKVADAVAHILEALPTKSAHQVEILTELVRRYYGLPEALKLNSRHKAYRPLMVKNGLVLNDESWQLSDAAVKLL